MQSIYETYTDAKKENEKKSKYMEKTSEEKKSIRLINSRLLRLAGWQWLCVGCIELFGVHGGGTQGLWGGPERGPEGVGGINFVRLGSRTLACEGAEQGHPWMVCGSRRWRGCVGAGGSLATRRGHTNKVRAARAIVFLELHIAISLPWSLSTCLVVRQLAGFGKISCGLM